MMSTSPSCAQSVVARSFPALTHCRVIGVRHVGDVARAGVRSATFDSSTSKPVMRISAQSRLEAFYAGFGFQPIGEPYMEDGIPHANAAAGLTQSAAWRLRAPRSQRTACSRVVPHICIDGCSPEQHAGRSGLPKIKQRFAASSQRSACPPACRRACPESGSRSKARCSTRRRRVGIPWPERSKRAGGAAARDPSGDQSPRPRGDVFRVLPGDHDARLCGDRPVHGPRPRRRHGHHRRHLHGHQLPSLHRRCPDLETPQVNSDSRHRPFRRARSVNVHLPQSSRMRFLRCALLRPPSLSRCCCSAFWPSRSRGAPLSMQPSERLRKSASISPSTFSMRCLSRRF